jgi:hypothetical protein
MQIWHFIFVKTGPMNFLVGIHFTMLVINKIISRTRLRYIMYK